MYIIVARALTRLIGLLRRFRDDGIHRRHSGGIHGRVIGRRSVLIAGAVFHRSVFATLLGAFRADVVCRADSERRNASRNECHDLLFSTYLFVCVIIERARLNGERERESLDPYRWSERGGFLCFFNPAFFSAGLLKKKKKEEIDVFLRFSSFRRDKKIQSNSLIITITLLHAPAVSCTL